MLLSTVSKAEALTPADDTDDAPEEPESSKADFTGDDKSLTASTTPGGSTDMAKSDEMDKSGSQVPPIPGVEKLANAKTFLGERDGAEALVEKLKELGKQFNDGEASWGSVPVQSGRELCSNFWRRKSPVVDAICWSAASRMRTQRREIRSTIPSVREYRNVLLASHAVGRANQLELMQIWTRDMPASLIRISVCLLLEHVNSLR